MIVVSGLTKTYGPNRGVSSIGLTVADSEVVAIVGPNGAGKTTLVKVLAGLAAHEAGSFELTPAPREGEASCPDIGVMPEAAPLFDLLTGREHLCFLGDVWRLPAGVRDARIAELDGVLGLDEALDRPVGQYSKGMRQKLAFASAILPDPRVLLLDEPFEGVDPVTVRAMKEVLLQFRGAGASILVTSHMLDTISEIFDRVVVLVDGRVQFSGDKRQLEERVRGSEAELPQGACDLERLYLGLVAPSRSALHLSTLARGR